MNKVYEREIRVAIDLARKAGAAALEYYGGPLIVEHKGSLDEPVTQADHLANEMIVQALKKEFPGDGILAEESKDNKERLSCDRVWMVDPIDGTKGFIEGSGDFAVQIGLAVGGQSVLGVVYQPVPDVLYWAAKGDGSWVERRETGRERLQVSDEKDFSRIRLAASRSHRSQLMDTLISALGIKEEVRRHSVGIKVGLIVERQCDLYIHLSKGTKQWDTCAPEAILCEAGGRMTDIWGVPLRYNSPDVLNHNGIVVSNGITHDLVIEQLVPLLERFGRQRIES